MKVHVTEMMTHCDTHTKHPRMHIDMPKEKILRPPNDLVLRNSTEDKCDFTQRCGFLVLVCFYGMCVCVCACKRDRERDTETHR